MVKFKRNFKFRKPEDLQNQTVVGAPLLPKPVEEKPYVRKLQKVDTPETGNTKSVETKKISSAKPNDDSEGVKGTKSIGSPTKHLDQLLDIAKKEKRQRTEIVSTGKGHVLKETQPEPMEVDSASSEIKAQEPVELRTVLMPENEDSLDEFIFVIAIY